MPPSGARISVIIPALNEERSLGAAVASVRADADVIVVDGGSHDRTADVALAAGARVIRSARGRGRQLGAGAAEAHGDWLVFLHADTRLDPGWAAALRALGERVVGGAFGFAVDSPRRVFRWLEAGVRARCALLRLPYGDQAMFARRQAYERIGGVAPWPLMEDIDFARRLGRIGALAFPSVRAVTSARRWEQRGFVTTTLINWTLLGMYATGWPPERLARLYAGRTS